MKNIEILSQMRSKKKDIWVTEDKAQYFFMIDQSPAEPIFCTYEIKPGDKVNQGNFGKVFKAKVLNTETGEAVPDLFIAIKMVPEKIYDPKLKQYVPCFDKQEHKIASYQMPTGKVISSKNDKEELTYYIPLDFIDGAPIGDKRNEINKLLEEMDDEQRLNLIIDVLLECNEMHKNFIHRDLRGGNILLQKISNPDGRISYKAHIIDWGLAHPISSSLKPSGPIPNYAPLEAHYGNLFGTFTDIYMISAVIANILGNYKTAFMGALSAYSYYISDLNNLGFDKFVHQCMTDYINRMRGSREHRPNKDEPLQFFLLLKQLQNLNQLSGEDKNISEHIKILKTKIYLLSKGYNGEDVFDKESCLELAQKKQGCDLYKMSSFPELNRKAYRNSYILVNNQLKYITSTDEMDDVKIMNIEKFLDDIKPFNLKDEQKVHLSYNQSKNLITSNGGHTHEFREKIDLIWEINNPKPSMEQKNNNKEAKEKNDIPVSHQTSEKHRRDLPKVQEVKEKKLVISKDRSDNPSSILKQLEIKYNGILKQVIKYIESRYKKKLATPMETIYLMAKQLEDKVTVEEFRKFRHKTILQLIKAANPSQYGSFFNKSPDYQIYESIKNLLVATLKEERQVNEEIARQKSRSI